MLLVFLFDVLREIILFLRVLFSDCQKEEEKKDTKETERKDKFQT